MKCNNCFFFTVLPEDGPTISGVKPQYQVGDDVNVTCSAGPSKPAASLRWYINGHEVLLFHRWQLLCAIYFI